MVGHACTIGVLTSCCDDDDDDDISLRFCIMQIRKVTII